MSEQNEQLAACPFCGGAGDKAKTAFSHYMTCMGCNADGPFEKTEAQAIAAWNRRAQPASTVQAEPFQQRVQPWMMACFGAEISADRAERNHRFLEESLELVQSAGCTASEAHQLVDYVFGRPVGEPAQEAGGVMVTLAALCLANGLDMHECGETELARIWTKVEAIRAKQAAKPKHSPLPQAQAPVSCEPAGKVARMLEGYAESYDQMGRDRKGDGKVHCTSVAQDIRQNMVTAAREIIAAAAPVSAAPDAEGGADAIDPEQEVERFFPLPDSPHASVIERATSNRSAWRIGWDARHAIGNLDWQQGYADAMDAFEGAAPQSAGAPSKPPRVTPQDHAVMAQVKADVADVVRGIEGIRERLGISAGAPVSEAEQAGDVCAQMRALCSACGGTGDVTSLTGEWLGSCDCEASKAPADGQELPALPEPTDQLAQADGFNVVGTSEVYTADQMQGDAIALFIDQVAQQMAERVPGPGGYPLTSSELASFKADYLGRLRAQFDAIVAAKQAGKAGA